MLIKEYDDSYEKKVLDLFENVFSRKLSEEYWPWRLNEYGKPIRYIMVDDKKVVGHYVVHPIPLEIYGKKTKSLFSMSVMTHTKFRGKNIFQLLASEIYKKAISLGYEFVFGFPNQNSASIHFDKLGWENHGQITEYVKKITPSICVNKSVYDIIEVNPNDEIIDLIWNQNKEKYPVIVPRTSAHVKWRFFSQPKQIFVDTSSLFYKLFVVQKNNFPKAYFVLKYFNTEKSHIVDMFGDLDKDVLNSIINYALIFSRDKKTEYLSFWSGRINHTEIQKICNDLGFLKHESTAYFGTKNLFHDNDRSLNNYYLTMSDSDIF